MFHDRARIHVQAGAGGNGAASFRREAHVPKGGPDGGDGGRGGDVAVVADPSLRDLSSFRRGAHFKARRGGHGEGANRHGATPDPLDIRVPPGTVVEDVDAGDRWELLSAGDRAVVARGGSGGRGNKRFATATRQSPRFAERGLPGEDRTLELRLRLKADAGLVGLPNAGKSSLIARMTRAQPKVADYPFTTLEPVLGTVEADERQIVIADIPGLIEGASGGAGLGHDFLAHVERCRVLVHVLDLAPLDGSDPVANHATIEAELAAHSPELAALPRVLALSKADLVPPEAAANARDAWRERLGGEIPVLVTSSATGLGLDDLKRLLLELLPPREALDTGEAAGEDDVAEYAVFRPAAAKSFEVARTGSGAFLVSGDAVERLIQRFDVDNEEAQAHIERRLKRMGVIAALEREGFEPGDDVALARRLVVDLVEVAVVVLQGLVLRPQAVEEGAAALGRDDPVSAADLHQD